MSEPLAAQETRKSRLAAWRSKGAPALLSATLLITGCDFFSTKDFSPKPAEIRTFSGSFAKGDTLSFRVIESLVEGSATSAPLVLSRKLLRFSRAAESLQPGNGWTAVSLRITKDPGGALLDEGMLLLRFDAGGLLLKSSDSSAAGTGGARFFPLKVAASMGTGGPGALDSGAFLSLPPAFTLGAAWLQALGVMEVAREVEETDTLDYQGHLEEAWRISETVLDGTNPLARGRFWYGASGLLKGEQTWPFEGRSADGSLSAATLLRRELVRI